MERSEAITRSKAGAPPDLAELKAQLEAAIGELLLGIEHMPEWGGGSGSFFYTFKTETARKVLKILGSGKDPKDELDAAQLAARNTGARDADLPRQVKLELTVDERAQTMSAIIMPLIAGPNLRQALLHLQRKGELVHPWVAATIVQQLVRDPLRALHGELRGLSSSADLEPARIHGDIKPENIILSEETKRPMLLDWGMSTTLGGPLLGGTFEYMSPEQWGRVLNDPALSALPLDKRTDIFSLGVLLFEMLTLAHPYVDKPNDLIEALTKKEELRLVLLAEPWRTRLAPILRSALALDAAQRFSSLLEMETQLNRFLSEFDLADKPVDIYIQGFIFHISHGLPFDPPKHRSQIPPVTKPLDFTFTLRKRGAIAALILAVVALIAVFIVRPSDEKTELELVPLSGKRCPSPEDLELASAAMKSRLEFLRTVATDFPTCAELPENQQLHDLRHRHRDKLIAVAPGAEVSPAMYRSLEILERIGFDEDLVAYWKQRGRPSP